MVVTYIWPPKTDDPEEVTTLITKADRVPYFNEVVYINLSSRNGYAAKYRGLVTHIVTKIDIISTSVTVHLEN